MQKKRTVETILLLFSILLASTPILTTKGLTLPDSNVRTFAKSMNLSNATVLDAQSTDIPTSEFKMLFVDGSWFETSEKNATLVQELKNTVLKKVPVIIAGGDGKLIYSIGDPRFSQSFNMTPLAQAVYFDGEKDYYFNVVGGSNLTDALQQANEWSNEKLQTPSSGNVPLPARAQIVASAVDPPAASFQSIVQTTNEFYDSPYGNLYVVENWWKLQYDQNPNNDWYICQMDTTSNPGHIAYPSINTWPWPYTGNFWCNYGIWNQADVTYYGDSDSIVSYGPTTTSGQNSWSVNIGVTGGEDP